MEFSGNFLQPHYFKDSRYLKYKDVYVSLQPFLLIDIHK